MGKNKTLIEKLKEFKEQVSKHIPLEKMIFFGSKATGKGDKHSDIDLIIVSKKFNKIRPIERGLNLYDYWDIDSPVDFLCYTPEEFKKAIKRIGLAAEAVKNGIII
jgi:predicted nucleotidyltransferase